MTIHHGYFDRVAARKSKELGAGVSFTVTKEEAEAEMKAHPFATFKETNWSGFILGLVTGLAIHWILK